jgi:hypothetical protein
MADAAHPVPVRLRHRMPGRTRISIPKPVPTTQQLETLADRLAGFAGVHAVDIRLQTGSIVIRHDQDSDPVAAAIEEGLLEILPEPPMEPFNPSVEIVKSVWKFDSYLRRETEGQLDARELVFSGLVAAALFQFARGRALGPSTSLLGQAASLALARPLGKLVK